MKKTIVKLLSTALCLTLFPLHVYAENTDKNNIEEEARIAELADQYCEELNMNTADALSVAEKVINGENLDCVKEEYSDMAPASVIQEDGYYKAEYIYPDGSKNIISITRTNWGTPSVSGGSYSSGSNWFTWNNAKVQVSNNYFLARYYANLAGSAYSASITSVWGGYATAYSGSISIITSPRIIVGSASTGNVAYAQMDFTYNNSNSSFTGYLMLYNKAGSNNVWSDCPKQGNY